MTTDKQKICKCGVNVAEFLGDTRTLEIYVRATNAGNFATNTSAFKSYVNTMARDINKIEDVCGIDADNMKRINTGILDKLEEMESIKDLKQFDEKKEYIFRDLDKITYDMVLRVKECSK